MGRIRTTFEVITEESASEGDVAERGWVDEEGEEVRGVHEAVRWLKDKGPLEPSSSEFYPGVWYSGPSERDEYGDYYQEAYHLVGFTTAQQQRIFDALFPKRLRANPGPPHRPGHPYNDRSGIGDRVKVLRGVAAGAWGTVTDVNTYGYLDGQGHYKVLLDPDGPGPAWAKENGRGIWVAGQDKWPRENPYGYDDEPEEDTERMRRLKAISDAVLRRKNPRRSRR